MEYRYGEAEIMWNAYTTEHREDGIHSETLA